MYSTGATLRFGLTGLFALSTVLVAAASLPGRIGGYSPGVYVCRGYGFAPPCQYIVPQAGECVNFQPGWTDNVSSFGPDIGDWECHLYEDADCGLTSWRVLTWPGSGDLNERGYDNVPKSFKCFDTDVVGWEGEQVRPGGGNG
ncbi:hypothetical protein BDY21DRAFT_372690 [Lineolata rhizophorae]|uniref:Beta/gamma crystallin 'Greek key' domain-containing protein n=1 Tax=Lineolata rhizophorae TaxID=578093 RepID=A0A6A6NX41_9PEZI|nr:hypothetical protein BDY21DRAFT_372690 [Lineolata rhizophorae]